MKNQVEDVSQNSDRFDERRKQDSTRRRAFNHHASAENPSAQVIARVVGARSALAFGNLSRETLEANYKNEV
jgi:hypothetical protein